MDYNKHNASRRVVVVLFHDREDFDLVFFFAAENCKINAIAELMLLFNIIAVLFIRLPKRKTQNGKTEN